MLPQQLENSIALSSTAPPILAVDVSPLMIPHVPTAPLCMWGGKSLRNAITRALSLMSAANVRPACFFLSVAAPLVAPCDYYYYTSARVLRSWWARLRRSTWPVPFCFLCCQFRVRLLRWRRIAAPRFSVICCSHGSGVRRASAPACHSLVRQATRPPYSSKLSVSCY